MPVTGITDGPTEAVLGVPLKLEGTVSPAGATEQDIVWFLRGTGASVTKVGEDYFLLVTRLSRFVNVTATIIDGLSPGFDYSQRFRIEVIPAFVPVVGILPTMPATMLTGTRLPLTADIKPNDATNQDIVWGMDIDKAGAEIDSNKKKMVDKTKPATVKVKVNIK